MSDERLNEYFRTSDFTRSQTAVRRGIDNWPGAQEMANITNILAPGMWRVRQFLGKPVFITSGFRSDALNAAVGGSKSSVHRHGLAADFICPQYGSTKKLAQALAREIDAIGFEQLIFEGTWCHIAFPALGSVAKGEVLTAHFAGAGVTYSRGVA